MFITILAFLLWAIGIVALIVGAVTKKPAAFVVAAAGIFFGR